MDTAFLLLSLVALAVCVIGAFVVWMVYFAESGEDAIAEEHRIQRRHRHRTGA
jgi:hypothetical protein